MIYKLACTIAVFVYSSCAFGCTDVILALEKKHDPAGDKLDYAGRFFVDLKNDGPTQLAVLKASAFSWVAAIHKDFPLSFTEPAGGAETFFEKSLASLRTATLPDGSWTFTYQSQDTLVPEYRGQVELRARITGDQLFFKVRGIHFSVVEQPAGRKHPRAPGLVRAIAVHSGLRFSNGQPRRGEVIFIPSQNPNVFRDTFQSSRDGSQHPIIFIANRGGNRPYIVPELGMFAANLGGTATVLAENYGVVYDTDGLAHVRPAHQGVSVSFFDGSPTLFVPPNGRGGLIDPARLARDVMSRVDRMPCPWDSGSEAK